MKNFDKEKLINLVRAKRAIWDKSHPHHFNKGILHKHWQAISAELQIPENVIKRQWKYLRQEFGRQLKRAATAAVIAPEEDDITSWPHYYSMLFVIDQFTSRGSEDATDSTSQPIEMLTPKIEVESAEDSDDDATFSLPPLQTTPRLPRVEVQLESDHSRGSSLTPEPTTQIPHDRKPVVPPAAQAQPVMRSAPNTTTAHHGQSPSQTIHRPDVSDYHVHSARDDDVAFFDSILPHVKSMKTELKFQFRMKVQKLLYDMLFPPPATQPTPESVPVDKSSEPGYLARIVPINK